MNAMSVLVAGIWSSLIAMTCRFRYNAIIVLAVGIYLTAQKKKKTESKIVMAKVLFTLPGRFVAGEIGQVLNCTFDKYKYFVKLPGQTDSPFGKMDREFFFHEGEVEIIKQS